MKLYDFMKISEEDWDTYDAVYDVGITVCYIEENKTNDNYDNFCIALMKKAEMEKQNGDILIVKWTDLIQNNMNKFRDFTEKYWRHKYRDDKDEFICQWINEIHLYFAGYVSEDFYDILIKFVDTLEA